MTTILHYVEAIRFAGLAIFLTLTLLLGRVLARLAPARRARSQPQRRNGAPTRLSPPGERY